MSWRKARNETEEILMPAIVACIQLARKLGAKAHKKLTGESAPRFSATGNAAEQEDSENCSNAEVDARILLLLQAIESFTI